MSSHIFQFDIDGKASRYSSAFDKYVEKWPGGHPEEQEELEAYTTWIATKHSLIGN